ncbi:MULTISPECIES: GNAT family N-acetyltransferase [unclassified Streptomyces]|uniref:GNAT family N-acetyltransferase n=1 Tax=unclassified Streptomyces TaxID=2593676 RepID=UPI002DDBAB72|nr:MULTISPECIES: GNAT family N-acetyltransferase [unclassified Streptomyces]WSA95778.1 GNAT family N-acetyltransferase [Streptomyces sp. NBC_01795]WSB80198.1 GNAT family N-acetyltransferase [Streptomyces sp. NBC_01775]WSS40309.1 GNAT family N-acetyltransferase [Streptomyces sp. NBC_01187]
MTPTVRTFRPEDAEAVAAIRRTAVPYLVCTAEALLWQVTHAPLSQRLRWLVAEEAEDADGTLTGCADAGLVAGSTKPGQAFLHTAVLPDAAGAGAGSALAAAGEAYLTALRARRVHAWVTDTPRACGFAERRGYVRSRLARFLGLDLRHATLPEVPGTLPDGLALCTAADLGKDLRPLYEADIECSADEPGDVSTGTMPYEEWLRLNWQRPDWDPELSGVVMAGDEVAAYSVAQTDGIDRYWSGMTGTRRAYRGRGLARLAKVAALRRARAAGYAHAFTGNDATNAPMLAVNRRLGYTEAGAEWRYVKEL